MSCCKHPISSARTEENLVVYYITPSEKVLATARNWFGKENVISIEEFLE
ncbi:hypothetical protein FLAVO9AF_30033 [Flavobacterium sp. 9AF]|nr:hypothetical protein [Flavobacterium sp. 9AF]VXB84176.1 hypothetical protein FLAVO9AF_30033 [Flavobacterium sp. 9AF]